MSLSMQYSNSFIIRHTPFYESHNHHLVIELSYSFFYLLHSLESFESIQRTIRIAYIIYQFDLNAWIFGGCCRFAESSWIIPNSMTGIFLFLRSVWHFAPIVLIQFRIYGSIHIARAKTRVWWRIRMFGVVCFDWIDGTLYKNVVEIDSIWVHLIWFGFLNHVYGNNHHPNTSQSRRYSSVSEQLQFAVEKLFDSSISMSIIKDICQENRLDYK